MRGKICLIFMLMLLLLVGCDDRNVNTPEIIVELEDTMLVNTSGYREIGMTIELKADDFETAFKRINVLFDDRVGELTGFNEGQHHIVTDSDSKSEFGFKIHNDANWQEVIPILFELDEFEKSNTTIELDYYRVPSVAFFTISDHSPIHYGEACDLSFKIYNSRLVEGLKVNFSTTSGAVTVENDITDRNGKVAAKFNPLAQGVVLLRASLDKFPGVSATLEFEVVTGE